MDEADRPVEPHFDRALGAWVLTRYADVSAALRDPRLSVSGPGDDGDAAHVTVRDAVALRFTPARLADWRAEFGTTALALVEALPEDLPLDLVRAFARPWSVSLAVQVTGAAPEDTERLDRLARDVFLAAASATDSAVPPPAQAAVAELARHFPDTGATAKVQTFIALSQTLPGLLAGGWLELVRRPDQADGLRSRPELMPGAVEELLRHAGPSRAVFRRARSETSIGGVPIAPGDRVILRLSAAAGTMVSLSTAAANHDPARFPNPDRLDVRRDAAGHLAFGAGACSCPGAPLIRVAVAVATEALLRVTSAVEPVGEAAWIGGFAIRAPASLPVVLRRQRPERPNSTA